MRVLIIEDEYGVAQNLCDILLELEPNIKILAILETIKDAVEWIKTNPKPDLGFFDIRIADGNSFEIFEKTKVDFPIIFTTAYDEYAVRAFEINALDYLMKPISDKRLKTAIERINITDLSLKKKIPNKFKYDDRLMVTYRDCINFIEISAIVLITAAQDYTLIFAEIF